MYGLHPSALRYNTKGFSYYYFRIMERIDFCFTLLLTAFFRGVIANGRIWLHILGVKLIKRASFRLVSCTSRVFVDKVIQSHTHLFF